MTEQEQQGESQQIEDGRRVAAFLEDEAVKRAVERVRAGLYDRFVNSTTSGQRTRCWATAKALEELQTELRAVVSTGEVAKHGRERREERERQQRRPGAPR